MFLDFKISEIAEIFKILAENIHLFVRFLPLNLTQKCSCFSITAFS